MKPFRSDWTLEDGLDMARQLRRVAAGYGWHVAIGGGVVHRGWSNKDLDLVMFPHDSTRETFNTRMIGDIGSILSKSGWELYRTVGEMHSYWETKGSKDRKWVEVWKTPDGKRVDLIWMLR